MSQIELVLKTIKYNYPLSVFQNVEKHVSLSKNHTQNVKINLEYFNEFFGGAIIPFKSIQLY